MVTAPMACWEPGDHRRVSDDLPARRGAWVPARPPQREEKARGEANFAPFVAQMLVASGRFRVSADTPDQVELFQGVARRVSDMLQRPVVSYANGRDIVITFGQEEAPALALCAGWALPRANAESSGPAAGQELYFGENFLWALLATRLPGSTRATR